MKLLLEIVAGPGRGQTIPIPIGQPLTVGRSPGMALCIAHDKSLSRRHFMIEYDGETCTLSDTGSSNGTQVNADRVTSATALSANDSIIAGNSVFMVRNAASQSDQSEQPSAGEASDSAPETADFLVDALLTSRHKLDTPAVRLNNTTPFPATSVFWQGGDGHPKLTVIIKATFELDEQHQPQIVQSQWPILTVDQYYADDIQRPVRLENDVARFKPRADVVLVGAAYAPGGIAASEFSIGLKVGKLRRVIRVFGDRYWVTSPDGTAVTATQPRAFTRMELTYERAFGGGDATRGVSYDYNPVGSGYIFDSSALAADGIKLPNFEDPEDLITSWQSMPKPVGFGVYGRAWLPRSAYSNPDTPNHHEAEFFNAAHPDLQIAGYLVGDETVDLANLTPSGRTRFALPGIRPGVMLRLASPDEATSQSPISNSGEDPVTAVPFNAMNTIGQTALDTLVLLPEDNAFYTVFRTVFDLSALEADQDVEIVITA